MLLIKRSPGITPFRPSSGASRILNKTPLNVLQNGPYYINHYIYCDNLDQQTLENIKAGTFISDKDTQLLDYHKGSSHNIDGLSHVHHSDSKTTAYTGDKEFHILHLPKDKPHDFEDVKLHLSLLHAHESPKQPEIDLELNKHLGNFEVNLKDIKPLDLDTSFLQSATESSSHEIVTPLIQGQVSTGQNHKYHNNLIQIADYLNENVHSERDHISQNYENLSGNQGSKEKEEVLDLPHFEQHPLEQDHGKSSYDTPGAVDSYGNPASNSHSEKIADSYQFSFDQSKSGYGSSEQVDSYGNSLRDQYSPHHGTGSSSIGFHDNRNGLNSDFTHGFKGNDLYQAEEYINEINSLNRRRRMNEPKVVSSTEKSNAESVKARYSNHKYE